MTIRIELERASPTPLHQQIAQQLRAAVVSGELATGARLEPVRALAARLRVNVNTVGRAYSTLAEAGLIDARRGAGSVVRPGAAVAGPALAPTAPASRDALRFAGSHDLRLADLLRQLAGRQPPVRVSARYCGSLAGLRALARGDADIAGSHLLDESSGEYNAPIVRRLLAGCRVSLVTLAVRRQGLVVQAGNPAGIRGVADLRRRDLTVARRQAGSGTRQLLDALLHAAGVPSGAIHYVDRSFPTHLGVAAAVAAGEATTGLAIEAAAAAYGLGFLPLAEEPYQLVIPEAVELRPEVQAILTALDGLNSPPPGRSLAGYDVRDSGVTAYVG